MNQPDSVYNRPIVSIGMPVYNGEKFIRESLDSLLAQTFTNFELIISDNASTDGTAAICQEYLLVDKRIRYVRQPKNRGYIANFHDVLKAAAGEYFMWAAADDLWDPSWVQTLLDELESGVAIAFGSVVSFQTDGRQSERTTLKPLLNARTLRMLRYYLWTNSTSRKADAYYGIYRTQEVLKVGNAVLGPADDRFGFDNIFVFSMLAAGGLKVIPNVTFYKRTRPTLGAHAIGAGMAVKLRELVPYCIEHIRRSPPGLTRIAIIAVTPIKFLWQLWRGLRRLVILTVKSSTGKRLSVGEIP